MADRPLPTPIHLLHSSTLIGGGNKVLLRLIDGLDRARFRPMSVVPQQGPMSEELARRHIETWHVELGATKASHLQRLATLGRLSQYLRRHGPSVVHANDPFTYGMSRRCLSPASSRWICHVHHPDVTEQILAWAFRVPPLRILTPSRHVAGRVSMLLTGPLAVHRDRIVPVMNPIDTTFFSPADDRAGLASSLGCDPAAQHLVMAGAVTAHKGQDIFLRLVKTLRDAGLSVKAHLIGGVQPGSEAYDASLRQLTSDLGLSEHVRFWGFASDDHVRDLFRIAEVFVLPTSEEGFGLVLAEAQACGTPVVTTDIAPLDEVVLHERTGLLTPRDADAMAAAVGAILRNPVQRRAMGLAAREWVVQSFAADSYCRKVAAVYEDVLDGRPAH